MIYLLGIFVIILDYLLSYFKPNYFLNPNYFASMFTLVLIVFMYKKIKKEKYFSFVFLVGFLYDLCFSYLMGFHLLIFFFYSNLLKRIEKYFHLNFVIKLLFLIIALFIYDFILFGLVYLSGYNQVFFKDLFNKFISSLFINILFFVLISIIFKNKFITKVK